MADGDPPVMVNIPMADGGLVGVPVGGCFGQATTELYGVPAEKFERARLALPRVDDVVSQSVADSRVDDLLGSYHACKKAASYDVESPAGLDKPLFETASAVLEGSAQPATLVKIEREILAADKTCKSSSGIGTAFAHSFLDHGGKTLKNTEGVVVEYQKMLDHAAAVIASPTYAGS